jgi:mannose-6-phosphate isomerase-like protein (cupin superfamily)
MATVVDVTGEFQKLTMLKGRTPTSDAEARKGAFKPLADYRDGRISSAKFAGISAWERHPKGDEIVQVVDGSTTLYLLNDEGKQTIELTAGMFAIVPQNTWHQFVAPEGVCVMTVTPQPTEHLRIDVEDPRTVLTD